ncbi:hypothetical protein SAMN05216356_10987 [Oribacterium sp. WCC10]|nr:hypothetical protein SAMN05216356_10987 [Oribacterium sp. WCC10]
MMGVSKAYVTLLYGISHVHMQYIVVMLNHQSEKYFIYNYDERTIHFS